MKILIGRSVPFPPAGVDHLTRLWARSPPYGGRGQRLFVPIVVLPGLRSGFDYPQRHLGRHLDGCRIGFDLGASDLKVSAVVNGEAIFSEEIVWEPVEQTAPAYHQSKIRGALKLAMSKMPRLDAIGGSSAGVIVDNRPMVASLFRGIPANRFGEIREMFPRISVLAPGTGPFYTHSPSCDPPWPVLILREPWSSPHGAVLTGCKVRNPGNSAFSAPATNTSPPLTSVVA